VNDAVRDALTGITLADMVPPARRYAAPSLSLSAE
jgi:hypothetical protein